MDILVGDTKPKTKWTDDKRWSDRFLPEIKGILGRELIYAAPLEEDACRNTDLIVLKFDSVRIACRVRRPGYATDYANQFTIRCSRPSGTTTELEKIVAGWGDYFFYGFSDSDEARLAAWLLGDLRVFRAWYVHTLAYTKEMPGTTIPNRDNSSNFKAFNIDELPSDFIIARKAA